MTIPENWASIDPTNPCLSNPHTLPLQTNFTKKSKNKSQYSEEDEDLTEESNSNSDSNSEDEEEGTINSDSGSECSSSSCSSTCSTCSDDEEDSDSSSSSISTSEIDFTKKSDHQSRKNNKQQEKTNKQLKNSVNKNRFFVESRSVIKPRNSATASTISSAEFNFVDQQNPVMSVNSTIINNISNKGSISQAETSNHSQNSNSKASSKLVTVNHQSSPNLNKKKNSSSNASTNASTSTTRKFFKRRAQQQQQTVNNALVRCRLFMVPPYSFFFCHTAPNRIQNCVVVLKHSKITLFNLLSTHCFEDFSNLYYNTFVESTYNIRLSYIDAC